MPYRAQFSKLRFSMTEKEQSKYKRQSIKRSLSCFAVGLIPRGLSNRPIFSSSMGDNSREGYVGGSFEGENSRINGIH